jgi:hypothetical protein
MGKKIEVLLESARKIRMSEPEKVEQRISFAFGNAKIENEDITREMVIEAANEK